MKKYLKCLLGAMSIGGLATIVSVPLVACSSQPQTIQTQEEPKNKVEDWYCDYWCDMIERTNNGLINPWVRMMKLVAPFDWKPPEIVIDKTNVATLQTEFRIWFNKQDKYQLYDDIKHHKVKYYIQLEVPPYGQKVWETTYVLELPKVGD